MAASSTKRLDRIVVLGRGNPSRGDDVLGLALVQQLERMGALHPAWPCLHLLPMHQLQPEHVLELQDRDAAVFVDAAVGLNKPYVFRPITPAMEIHANTHDFTPPELLRTYERALGAPPPSFVLELAGFAFDLDTPPSSEAAASLASAVAVLQWLLDHPSLEEWLAAATPGALSAGL